VQAGIPLFTIKEIMGHSTISLTERYSHLAPCAFQDAGGAMDQAACEITRRPKIEGCEYDELVKSKNHIT